MLTKVVLALARLVRKRAGTIGYSRWRWGCEVGKLGSNIALYNTWRKFETPEIVERQADDASDGCVGLNAW